MTLKIAPFNGKKREKDTLRIDATKERITATLRFIKFRDKDTRQIIIYVPSLELSAYGSTDKKAQNMLEIYLEEYFQTLMQFSKGKLATELSRLGWEHDKIRSKIYSKCFIDAEGKLQEFNAVEEDVVEGVLSF